MHDKPNYTTQRKIKTMFTKHFQDLEQLSIYDLINYIKSRLNIIYQLSSNICFLLQLIVQFDIDHYKGNYSFFKRAECMFKLRGPNVHKAYSTIWSS